MCSCVWAFADEYLHGGVPVAALERAWLAPFESDDRAKGGCPDLAAAMAHPSTRSDFS